MSFAGKWMQPESLTLGESSQSQKDKHPIFLHVVPEFTSKKSCVYTWHGSGNDMSRIERTNTDEERERKRNTESIFNVQCLLVWKHPYLTLYHVQSMHTMKRFCLKNERVRADETGPCPGGGSSFILNRYGSNVYLTSGSHIRICFLMDVPRTLIPTCVDASSSSRRVNVNQSDQHSVRNAETMKALLQFLKPGHPPSLCSCVCSISCSILVALSARDLLPSVLSECHEQHWPRYTSLFSPSRNSENRSPNSQNKSLFFPPKKVISAGLPTLCSMMFSLTGQDLELTESILWRMMLQLLIQTN